MGFNIGDRVRIIKEPVYIGAKGSDWMTPKSSDDDSFLTVYDMSHLIGEIGTISNYMPNIFARGDSWEEKVKNSKEIGIGFYQINFDNDVKIPIGLASEGFDEENLELIK